MAFIEPNVVAKDEPPPFVPLVFTTDVPPAPTVTAYEPTGKKTV
jgi:hypothetical protein